MRPIGHWMFVLVIACSAMAAASPCEDAERTLRAWTSSAAEQQQLVEALQTELSRLLPTIAPEAYCRTLLSDLAEKQQARAAGVQFTAEELVQHALQYERFRLETYLSAGVSPKRYFGFFDEQGDTATYERTLRRTVIEAVPILNDYARAQGLPVRVTEKEVVITFLAEGGALLLTEDQGRLERVHPVRGVGLDSFREGFARHPALLAQLDEHFGTRLSKLVWHVGKCSILLRPMTFREAILGTAIMYLFEKNLTATLLARAARPALSGLPLPRQFVETSFVYNSGMLFSEERVDQVLQFATGAYLVDVNLQNRGKRPTLPIFPADEAARRLQEGQRIPQQLTSWNAVYHVLQRYGAWVALARFSSVFDAEGRFRVR